MALDGFSFDALLPRFLFSKHDFLTAFALILRIESCDLTDLTGRFWWLNIFDS